MTQFYLKYLQRNIRRYLLPLRDFSGELLRTPSQVGAICPSSKYLGQAMVQAVDLADDRLVVELGAGTGSITRALIDHGVSADRLIVIEQSEVLARRLRRRFPNLTVIQGDATQLTTLLCEQAQNVAEVVSSLPLRSLESAMTESIIAEILKALGDGGRLTQFTYDLRKPSVPTDPGLHRVASFRVWANLPPARVDVFDRRRHDGDQATTA